MNEITLQTTLADCVARFPESADVLEEYGLDYCCGGRQTIAEACQASKGNLTALIAQLQNVIEAHVDLPPVDPRKLSLADLCDHIESTHHAYLREELPRLKVQLGRFVLLHGSAHQDLLQLVPLFQSLQDELVPHMLKEERVLFPAIRTLEAASAMPAFHFGAISNPIRMMEHEHEAVGGLLRQIRISTNGYQVLDDARSCWRALFSGLRKLESDLHLHIHKENNVLFPAAIKLADSIRVADDSPGQI